MKKKLLWVAITVAVALGAFLLLGGRKKADAKYRTALVDRGDITQTVTATGVLSAVTTVKVGSQVSGIIASLHADFNSEVAKGGLLAELDPTPFEAKVAQNAANLERARVEMRNAEIALKRQTSLKDQGLAPEADFDAAQANFDTSKAAVAQAEAALKQSQTDFLYTRIRAPIDGVVVNREYDVGQTVAASFQAPTLFTIAQDLTKMQVSADVSESDIGKVKTGQPVRFTVDAYPEKAFRGKIAQIRLNATVSQNVVTYPVIIAVANPDLQLRPNMTANVTIDVATVDDVLRVPNAALRWRPEAAAAASPEEAAARQTAGGGTGAMARQFDQATGRASRRNPNEQTVFVLPSPGAEPKPLSVRVGISDGRFTQIAGGELKPGNVVVIGAATARAGVSVPPGMGGPPGGVPRRGF